VVCCASVDEVTLQIRTTANRNLMSI